MSRGAASFYVIVGAPGAGKTSQIQCELRDVPAPRRMIFDIEAEGEFNAAGVVVRTTEAIRQALIAAGPRGPVGVVYQPGTDDPVLLRKRFDTFCRLAFAARNVLVVVDELADVDSPNPREVVPGWAQLLRRGRKRGIGFIVGTQRPADMNNRIWSFATRMRVGALADSDDVRELAGVVMVDRAEVAALLPGEWIERDRTKGATTRGRIVWRRGRPVNEPRPAPGQQKKSAPAGRAQ